MIEQSKSTTYKWFVFKNPDHEYLKRNVWQGVELTKKIEDAKLFTFEEHLGNESYYKLSHNLCPLQLKIIIEPLGPI